MEKSITGTKLHMPEPEYNIDFLCNSANRNIILTNIRKRKGIGDIDKVIEYSNRPEKRELFLQELSKIPNCSHPAILDYGDKPRLLKKCGKKLEYDFELEDFIKLVTNLKAIRVHNLGPSCGQRSYVLLGDLAQLEEALVQYTIRKLMTHGFNLLSVPDIIPTQIIERCGLITDHDRTLVYNLDSSYGSDYSLSGTAEMSLANKLINSSFSYNELPLKVAAVSRCYRAEGSSTHSEKGMYR